MLRQRLSRRLRMGLSRGLMAVFAPLVWVVLLLVRLISIPFRGEAQEEDPERFRSRKSGQKMASLTEFLYRTQTSDCSGKEHARIWQAGRGGKYGSTARSQPSRMEFGQPGGGCDEKNSQKADF